MYVFFNKNILCFLRKPNIDVNFQPINQYYLKRSRQIERRYIILLSCNIMYNVIYF